MKLYFYFLELYSNKPYIRAEECEVKEKPKTYRPIKEFPKGYYYVFVNKGDIGKITGFQNNVVILLKNDIEKVAKIFMEKCESEISKEKRYIRLAEKDVERQRQTIEIIKEWRNEKCSK